MNTRDDSMPGGAHLCVAGSFERGIRFGERLEASGGEAARARARPRTLRFDARKREGPFALCRTTNEREDAGVRGDCPLEGWARPRTALRRSPGPWRSPYAAASGRADRVHRTRRDRPRLPRVLPRMSTEPSVRWRESWLYQFNAHAGIPLQSGSGCLGPGKAPTCPKLTQETFPICRTV